MKNRVITILLLAVIILAVLGYFVMTKTATHNNTSIAATPFPPSPTTSSPAQTLQCQNDQLSATISAQGAAGNIYATLEMTNSGKTACEVMLGNTVTAVFDAKNIVIHYQQTIPSENFTLTPNAKVYSQIHYPNGPQCQSGITEEPITFLYKTAQTTVLFKTASPQNEKLIVQACKSQSEKTTIDIWPLSQSPITQ